MIDNTNDWIVLLGSLALAVGLVALRRPAIKAKLAEHMGQGSWDFSTSWASNLTGAGGFLTTILAASIVPVGSPPATDATKPASPAIGLIDDYVAMSLFFVLLAIIAAITYKATMAPVEVDTGNGQKALQPQGTVGGFLVASALTLWSVFGQIVTVGLVFGVIQSQHDLSAISTLIFWIVLALAVVSILIFSWRSIPETIREQASPEARARRRARLANEMRANQVAVPANEEEIRAPLPPWSLL